MTGDRIVVIGGGAAGLAAVYTLKKRGFAPILLEAAGGVGGRLRGDRVDGFRLDTGADFFCSSYDTAFRICKELGVPLVGARNKLGWFRNGRWATTTPGLSAGNLVRNLSAGRALGLMSPRAVRASMRLFSETIRHEEYLSFASDSRIAELDTEESFDDCLQRFDMPDSEQTTIKGFLEAATMGHVGFSDQAYMRTYLVEALLKADQLRVPEKGAGALAEALAEACSDAVRLSMPARGVTIRDGSVSGVSVDGGAIDADAVICAIPATKVSDIIPGLPEDIRRTLVGIGYSSGCRVVIGLDHPPLPVGWNGALWPEDDTPLLLDRSINLPSCVPAGTSTLDMIAGCDRARELIPLDDEEITRRMLCDARRNPPPGSALPADGEWLFSRVYRWEEAVCMVPPGMFKAVADMRDRLRQDVDNLVLAGDYMRVPSVNGALASGVDAAEEVVEMLERRPAYLLEH